MSLPETVQVRGIGKIPTTHILVWIAILLVALALRLFAGPLWIDDAYITFRYAQNIAIGNGFVYNIGEPVLGTSTPLFTLALATARLGGVDPQYSSIAIGILSDLLLVTLFMLLGQALGRFWEGAATALWVAVYSPMALAAVSGMETAFYAAMVVSTFTLYVLGRVRWAIFFAVLVALIRPEGFLVLGALFAVSIWRREWHWRDWLLTLLLLPWVLYSFVTFGSIIPQSVLAKAAIYPAYQDPLHNTIQLLGSLSAPFVLLPGILLALLSPDSFGVTVMSGILVLLAGGLFLFGLAQIRNTRALALGLWLVANFIFFAAPNRLLFPWYATPLLGGFLFIALVGAADLSRLASGNHSKLVRTGAFVTVAAIAILMLAQSWFALGSQRWDLAHREGMYACIGRELEPFARADATVASPEIGALGYAYSGPILDLTGLVSPVAVSYYRAPDFVFHYPHSIPLPLLAATHPPFLVLFDKLAPEVVASDWIRANYRTVQSYPGLHPYYGSLAVYARKDINSTLGSCTPD